MDFGGGNEKSLSLKAAPLRAELSDLFESCTEKQISSSSIQPRKAFSEFRGEKVNHHPSKS
jgi:hypothetical protein